MDKKRSSLHRAMRVIGEKMLLVGMQDFKSETRIPKEFFYILIASYFSVLSINNFRAENFIFSSRNFLHFYEHAIRIFVTCYTGMVFTKIILALVLANPKRSRTTFFMYLNAMLKQINLYIIMPVTSWGCMTTLYEVFYEHEEVGEETLADVAWVMSVLILSSFICLLQLTIFRNSLPQNNGLSSVSKFKETSSYFLTILLSVFTMIQENFFGSRSTFYLVRSFICVLFIIQYIFLVQFPVFWNIQLSIWYTSCYSMLLVYTAVTSALYDSSDEIQMIAFVMIGSLAFKLTRNLMIMRLRMLFIKSRDSKLEEIAPSLFLQELLKDEIANGNLPEDLSQLLLLVSFENTTSYHQESESESLKLKAFHQGLLRVDQIQSSSPAPQEIKNTQNQDGQDTRPTKSPILRYIRSQKQNGLSKMGIEDCLWLLTAQILYLETNMTSFYLTIKRAQTLLGDSTFPSQKLGHLETILKFRFLTCYEQTFSPEEFRKTSYDSLLLLMETQENEINDQVFDLKRILDMKNDVIKVGKKIQDVVGAKTDLLGEVLTGGKKVTLDFIEYHRKILNQLKEIDSDFKGYLKLDGCSSYFQMIHVLYIFSVKNKITEAKRLFQQYKQRIITLNYYLSKREVNMKSDPPDLNSVVFSMSLEKGKEGLINNATMDSSSYLCSQESLNIIGKNVNSLFPEKLMKYHFSAMVHGMPVSILQRHSAFFLKGLEGNLREVEFILRLSPNFQEGPSLLSLIKPVINKTSALVILDTDFKVLAAEKGFWDVIDLVDYDERNLSFECISKEACIGILLKNISSQLESTKKNASSLTKDYKWMAIFKESLDVVKTNSLVCSWTAGSIFADSLVDVSMTVTSEAAEFCGLEYYKVYVSFTFGSSKESKEIKQTLQDKGSTVVKVQDQGEFEKKSTEEDLPGMKEAGVKSKSVSERNGSSQDGRSFSMEIGQILKMINVHFQDLTTLLEESGKMDSHVDKYLFQFLFDFFSSTMTIEKKPSDMAPTKDYLIHLSLPDTQDFDYGSRVTSLSKFGYPSKEKAPKTHESEEDQDNRLDVAKKYDLLPVKKKDNMEDQNSRMMKHKSVELLEQQLSASKISISDSKQINFQTKSAKAPTIEEMKNTREANREVRQENMRYLLDGITGDLRNIRRVGNLTNGILTDKTKISSAKTHNPDLVLTLKKKNDNIIRLPQTKNDKIKVSPRMNSEGKFQTQTQERPRLGTNSKYLKRIAILCNVVHASHRAVAIICYRIESIMPTR